MDAKYWIDKLELSPHEEGGHYKQTFESDFKFSENSLKDSHGEQRSASTLIYYLLESGDFSQFHRLKSDEIWLFHKGQPLNIYELDPRLGLKIHKLGPDIELQQNFQILIPANRWFAAEVAGNNGFTLVSCMVSPGFSYQDFEIADKESLSGSFPGFVKVIEKFTR